MDKIFEVLFVDIAPCLMYARSAEKAAIKAAAYGIVSKVLEADPLDTWLRLKNDEIEAYF